MEINFDRPCLVLSIDIIGYDIQWECLVNYFSDMVGHTRTKKSEVTRNIFQVNLSRPFSEDTWPFLDNRAYWQLPPVNQDGGAFVGPAMPTERWWCGHSKSFCSYAASIVAVTIRVVPYTHRLRGVNVNDKKKGNWKMTFPVYTPPVAPFIAANELLLNCCTFISLWILIYSSLIFAWN